MSNISPSDTISLSAIRNGMECLAFTLSGFASIAEVLREIRRRAGNLSGLISVRMRNITQGWSRCQSLILRPIPMRHHQYPSLFETM